MLRLFAFLSLIVLALPAQAERRVALIIGNSNYQNTSGLANPSSDAELLAKTLAELEFEVDLEKDLTRAEMSETFGAFLNKSDGADLAVFYFAGHGMQFDQRNFLLGTDAALASEFDIEGETIGVEKVIAAMERRTKASLIFIDACRNNPLADTFYRTNFSETRALGSRGLAPMGAAYQGSMVVFSAAPGQVAQDGKGSNSPFAESLARNLTAENTEILTLMKRVIGDVKRATNEEQQPVVTNNLAKEIYLKLGSGSAGVDILAQQEQAMFNAATEINSERAWDVFIARYPSGDLHDMAVEARAALDRAQPTATAAAPVSVAATREAAQAEETTLALSKADAIAIQQALNQLGYSAGTPDGVFGRNTRKAIADFQAAQGLASTGAVTGETAAKLGLTLATAESGSEVFTSSKNARKYDPQTLAQIESDPRLLNAAKVLEGKEYLYGFYENRLYLAVLNWTWEEYKVAEEMAASVGGHLATLTSAKENDFAFELVRYDERLWKQHSTRPETRFGPTFGLYQAEGAREPDGGWQWVTGEPLIFQNWQPGSPLNADGNSNYGAFMWDIWGRNKKPDGTFAAPFWHDFSHATPSLLIEIE